MSGAALLDGNYDFTGFDPFDQNDINRVGFSKFIINNVNQNSIYWATPRTIGGVGDVDYWFTYDNGQFPSAPSLSDCANGFNTSGGRLSKADLSVLSNNYPSYLGFPASAWEAGFRLFSNLDQYPALCTPGSAAQAFYNNNSTATIGKLYTALKTVRFIGQSTQSINAKQTEVESLLNQIYALDAQIIDAQSDTQETLMLTQRDTLVTQYLQKQSEYEQLAGNFSSTLQQQANAQLTILNGTTANTTWEQNLKLVLQYQLGMVWSGQPLSQTQNTVVQAIANQCRYEGGYGVLLARKMLPDQLYDDDILCSGRNDNSGKNQANEVVIYPNPACNFILLASPKQTDAGTALLFNALGQLVRNFTWSGFETRLDISDLPNGTYFFNVNAEEQPAFMKKVVIIR